MSAVPPEPVPPPDGSGENPYASSLTSLDEQSLAAPTSPYAALFVRDFRWYLSGNLLFLFGSQMQAVAVMWEIYERTHSAIYLGLVGLAQVLPVLLLALPAGQLIDRLDRRHVVMGSLLAFAGSSLLLAMVSIWKWPVGCVFLALVINGSARAFQQPAKSALLPLLVPRESFPSAVTFGTSSFQFATVIGPGLGGLVLSWLGHAVGIYLLDAVLAAWFFFAICMIAPRPPVHVVEPVSIRSLGAGLTFLFQTKLLLGAITLDMFAVLFGGATAMLPIYSKDILKMGPSSLGWLQAAPGIGALVVSVILTNLPPIRRAGSTLMWSVVGFGIATIIFGFARSFWLAWVTLAVIGGLDMISVIIRHTLIQLWTPDSMRGRVSAVNGLFISISNEMGSFESGLVAQCFHRANDVAFGPTVSVVSGGVGSLIVVLITAIAFPSLRRHGRLNELPPAEQTTSQP